MGIPLLLSMVFLSSAMAFDSGRKCINLIIPKPEYLPKNQIIQKGRAADRIPNSEKQKIEKFIQLQSIENQKLLATALWSQLVAKKNVEEITDTMSSKKQAAHVARHSGTIYTDIDTVRYAAQRSKQLDPLVKLLDRSQRQVSLVISENFKTKVAKYESGEEFKRFYGQGSLNDFKEFNKYVSEALRLNISAASAMEFIEIRIREKKNFQNLTFDCLPEDPLAQAIARQNYELVNVFGKKTYVMNYACNATKKMPLVSEDQCLKEFRLGLDLKGCKIAEKFFCKAEGKTGTCQAETLNCFDQYRDETLKSVAEAKGCPVGFKFVNTEKYQFCIKID